MDEKEDRQVEAIVKISRLEPNFTVLCRVAFGINFKVKDWNLDNNDELVNVMRTSESSANPITVDEEEVEDEAN